VVDHANAQSTPTVDGRVPRFARFPHKELVTRREARPERRGAFGVKNNHIVRAISLGVTSTNDMAGRDATAPAQHVAHAALIADKVRILCPVVTCIHRRLEAAATDCAVSGADRSRRAQRRAANKGRAEA
jgi:hypothetical protein